MVASELQSLIDAYDLAVEAILLDPSVADDRGSAQVVAFLALFPADNTFATGSLEFWAQEGSAGRSYRPGPRGRMYRSTVQTVEPSSADEATVIVCTLKSLVVIDPSRAEQSAEGGVAAGSVATVRVNGVWLIRDLTRIDAGVCPDPRDQP